MTAHDQTPDAPFAPRPLRVAGTAAAVTALALLLITASCHDTRGRIARIETVLADQGRGIGNAVVHLAADERSAPGAPGQLEHIVTALGSNLGVRFIDLQGDRGLSLATPDAAAMLAAAPPPGDAHGDRREYDTPQGPVFEVATRGRLGDGENVVVRVGLDPAALQALRTDVSTRSRLRLGVGIAAAALASVLLLSLQRQAVLGREVARVRRRLERHEEEARRTEKLAAMGALAAAVAHQLRNPLNSIHLLAQVLAGDAALPDAARANVGRIRTETARIDARIRQFLDFARPREPVLESVAVDEVVQSVADLQAAARGGSGVEIVGYAPSPQVLTTDRSFLVEILENLVANAVEAGATKVMASLVAGPDDLEIAVADNGPGVPPAERGRIFDLYYTTRADGNGLGLSIASQMAAALGGAVALADEPGLEGRGARFSVRLPRTRSAT